MLSGGGAGTLSEGGDVVRGRGRCQGAGTLSGGGDVVRGLGRCQGAVMLSEGGDVVRDHGCCHGAGTLLGGITVTSEIDTTSQQPTMAAPRGANENSVGFSKKILSKQYDSPCRYTALSKRRKYKNTFSLKPFNLKSLEEQAPISIYYCQEY